MLVKSSVLQGIRKTEPRPVALPLHVDTMQTDTSEKQDSQRAKLVMNPLDIDYFCKRARSVSTHQALSPSSQSHEKELKRYA